MDDKKRMRVLEWGSTYFSANRARSALRAFFPSSPLPPIAKIFTAIIILATVTILANNRFTCICDFASDLLDFSSWQISQEDSRFEISFIFLSFP